MSLRASNLNYWGYSTPRLRAADLLLPLFVSPQLSRPQPLESLPGIMQYDLPGAVCAARHAAELGIRGVVPYALGLPRDRDGSSAVRHDGPLAALIARLRAELPELFIVTDLCLCQYTEHGHCGELWKGEIDNDRTLPRLVEMARMLAASGADAVMPSGMMDGAVGAVRRGLEQAGYQHTLIFSQAAKIDSGLYGPFRRVSAGLSTTAAKSTYQTAPANARQAHREAVSDLEEGADALVVKPTLGYLDLLASIHERCELPIIAYCTGGEFAVLHGGTGSDFAPDQLAPLYAAKRAGASMIVTYAAARIAAEIADPGRLAPIGP